MSKIYIGSDHAGFDFKEKLKSFIIKKGFETEDLSPLYDKSDDYPDHAFKVAGKVSETPDSKGILICGTGSGMVIAANKVKGIRAVEAYDPYSAKMSRVDNNANVLCLREREFSLPKTKKIIDIWLNTPFSGEERHKRRIEKIREYECGEYGKYGK